MFLCASVTKTCVNVSVSHRGRRVIGTQSFMGHTECTDLHRIFVSRRGREGVGAYSVNFVYSVCNKYVLMYFCHKNFAASYTLRPLRDTKQLCVTP